jgi:hypothetical protein
MRLTHFVRRMIASLFGGRRPPRDPYAPVRVPRKQGPGGRHAVAAVIEPRDHDDVNAVGHSRPR